MWDNFSRTEKLTYCHLTFPQNSTDRSALQIRCLAAGRFFSLLRTADRKEGKGKSEQATAARKNTATKSLNNSIIIYCSMAQSLENQLEGRQKSGH